MEKEFKENKNKKECEKDCTDCNKDEIKNNQNHTKCEKNNDGCNKGNKKCKNKEPKERFNPKEEKKKLLAEMENFRKRFEEEKMHFLKYRSSSFLLEVLPTLDMFEMALKAKVSDEVKT